MTSTLSIPNSILKASIEEIRKVGLEKREGFLVWLGKREKHGASVVQELFVPQYESGSKFYRVTQQGNLDLMRRLKDTKTIVLAQLHSHPNEAFHSTSDDRLATVSCIGGLSFVLPNFGELSAVNSFQTLVKVYKLEAGGAWVETDQQNYGIVDG